MNLTIQTLNLWGARALDLAWPLLWQSSLLIGVLFALDLALRRKVRAAVWYALWLVVLLKLLLPPALALPTGAAWWLRPAKPAPAVPPIAAFTVTYGPVISSAAPTAPVPAVAAPVHPSLSRAGWALVASGAVSFGLLVWMLVRWQQVARDVRQAVPAEPALLGLLEETRKGVGLRRSARLGLTQRDLSPAVCGLFRPRILLPRSLAQQLSPAQLRAVLLHELIHLGRGDVWVNCAQTLLQILCWWHPLLWLANARIRQVREEAVDDAVMAALREDAESYAPTLLEVARLALQRPLNSLGLVGILESRSSLHQRIQRLIDCHPPRKAGLTLASAVMVLGFAAVAVPMGEAPAPKPDQAATSAATNSPASGVATNAVSSEQKLRASKLVHDGMLLYQMGKLEEATNLLQQAAKLDPQNQAAYYYLNLVVKARNHDALKPGDSGSRERLQDQEREWALPTGKGRQAIYAKLNRIRLDEVKFDGLPLSEVLIKLNDQAREHDPEHRGINFIINPNVEAATVTAQTTPGAIDPTTGLPAAPATSAGHGVNISTASVKLSRPLTNVTLEQALDAIVNVVNIPIKYSVEEYGVVFSPRLATAPALFTRQYVVDPNSFLAGLHAATGVKSNTPARTVSELARECFTTRGAELNPPKSIFYNERLKRLYVRAEQKDLDIIDKAFQEWTAAYKVPNQINLKARFIELPEAEAAAFRSQFGATNVPGSGTWGAILTPGQAKLLLDQWSPQGDNVLAAPEVTTISGRQAQMKATQKTNVVFSDSYRLERVGGLHSTNTFIACTNSAPQTNAIEVGSIIDLLPTLLDDEWTVRLVTLASVTEFLGYETPGAQGSSPRPSIRFRDLGGATAFVRDGQTVVLGGPVTEDAASGRKVHLLVLITATLITPEGNQLHDNETLRAIGQSKLPLEAPPAGWSQVKLEK